MSKIFISVFITFIYLYSMEMHWKYFSFAFGIQMSVIDFT